MKKTLPLGIIAMLLVLIPASLAQERGPLVIIQGTPDTTTAPPQVRTYVSVIDPNTAQNIGDLGADSFQVKEAGTGIGTPDLSYEPVGLAVAIVVDRGGISAPGDTRIHQATDLVRELVNRLSATGASSDDIAAIVGVGEGGVLQPEENFSYNPVDYNLVRNALVAMEGEAVRGGTPLYEGLDEALRLLTANPDATIRDVLSHRRKVIVVFSDGIDPNFSDEVREQDIIRKANAADISIYAIGMAQRGGSLSAEGNLKRLAHETFGLYQLHNNEETHAQVLTLFDNIVTQRNQYLVSYATRQPKGTYTLDVRVNTAIGSADDAVHFSSVLEPPQVMLSSPTEGAVYTVPYSHTPRVEIPLSVSLAFPDGVGRDPSVVRYYANGVLVATSTAAPFDARWDVTDYITQTEETADTQETKVEQFTFIAQADDSYLPQTVASAPVNVEVRWEPLPPRTIPQKTVKWLGLYWWLLGILAALAVGLLVLLILLIRTRGELARKVITSTTGVLKGITRPLSAAMARAPGKLVVVQGANVGKEFRLSGAVVKVGRDPQFCDFALYDEYVSNPHFSIQQDQTQFYITDEGSKNGTRVNGVPISPHQRMLLQPDAVIEVGMTRLQFKRLGGTTRQLGQPVPAAPGAPAPYQPPGPTYQPPPPTQVQPPGAQPPGPTYQPPPTQVRPPGAQPPGPTYQPPPPTQVQPPGAQPPGPGAPQQPQPTPQPPVRGGPTKVIH